MVATLPRTEALILSYFVLFLEVFALVALTLGYKGVIVMLVAAAATMLTGIVIVTATGLK